MFLANEYILEALSSEGQITGSWEYDFSTEMIQIDSNLIKLLGHHHGQHSLSVHSFLNYFQGETIATLQRHLLELFKCEKSFSLSLQFKNHSEEIKTVKIIGQSFKTEDDQKFGGLVQDITLSTRKDVIHLNNNIELSSYERGLNQFTVVARTDARGRINYVNDEFCRLSKYTSEELIGKDHRILNSKVHDKDFFKKVWQNVLNGKSWRGEICNKAKDGNLYWVDTIIIPIYDKNRELKEILSFRFDITRLKTLEKENEILKDKIKQINSLESEFPSQ